MARKTDLLKFGLMEQAIVRRDRISYISGWLALVPHPCTPKGNQPFLHPTPIAPECEKQIRDSLAQWDRPWPEIEAEWMPKIKGLTSS